MALSEEGAVAPRSSWWWRWTSSWRSTWYWTSTWCVDVDVDVVVLEVEVVVGVLVVVVVVLLVDVVEDVDVLDVVLGAAMSATSRVYSPIEPYATNPVSGVSQALPAISTVKGPVVAGTTVLSDQPVTLAGSIAMTTSPSASRTVMRASRFVAFAPPVTVTRVDPLPGATRNTSTSPSTPIRPPWVPVATGVAEAAALPWSSARTPPRDPISARSSSPVLLAPGYCPFDQWDTDRL